MRFAVIAALALAAAPAAAASIVLATNAERPALRVDVKGNVEVSWESGGRRQTLIVPVRGPVRPGGTLAGRDVTHAVSAPAIAFRQVLRLGPGGWYYSLQAWQPAPAAPAELHFSRWRGAATNARMIARKTSVGDELSGTVTFGGKPIPMTSQTPEGKTLFAFVFLDALVGGEWKRVGGVAPRSDGSYKELVPYTLVGERYRATVSGPNIGTMYAPDATVIAVREPR